MRLSDLEAKVGRRFARLTTNAVVSRPRLWRGFRWLMRAQFDRLAPGLGLDAPDRGVRGPRARARRAARGAQASARPRHRYGARRLRRRAALPGSRGRGCRPRAEHDRAGSSQHPARAGRTRALRAGGRGAAPVRGRGLRPRSARQHDPVLRRARAGDRSERVRRASPSRPAPRRRSGCRRNACAASSARTDSRTLRTSRSRVPPRFLLARPTALRLPGYKDVRGAVTRPGRPSFASGVARLGDRGEVAQLVEHTAENRGVAGSIPALAISLVVRNSLASVSSQDTRHRWR